MAFGSLFIVEKVSQKQLRVELPTWVWRDICLQVYCVTCAQLGQLSSKWGIEPFSQLLIHLQDHLSQWVLSILTDACLINIIYDYLLSSKEVNSVYKIENGHKIINLAQNGGLLLHMRGDLKIKHECLVCHQNLTVKERWLCIRMTVNEGFYCTYTLVCNNTEDFYTTYIL